MSRSHNAFVVCARFRFNLRSHLHTAILIASAVVVLVSFGATRLTAATFTWNTGVTGSWTSGPNWVGGVAPSPSTSTDDVIIDGETLSGSVVSLNANGVVNNLNSLAISSGDRLELTTAAERRLLLNGAIGQLTNAGTITTSGGSARIVLDVKPAAANSNSGIIEATNNSNIWLGFSLGAYAINNAGGTIRATTGGTLISRQTITINGGIFDVQTGSFVDHESWSDGFILNNLTATNAGTYRAILTPTTGGNRFGTLSGNTTFANSGTINIQNLSTHATANVEAFFSVGNSASLITTGSSVINIQQNSTTGGTGHNAYLQLGASATPFTINGAMNITSVAGSQGTAQLRSSRPVSNAGNITVNGSAASIAMAGQNFTQTAGQLFLDGDAQVNAALVSIAGGSLGGTGIINGDLSLDDTLNMRIGTIDDLLTVNGNVVLNSSTSILDLNQIGSFTGPIDLVQFTGTLTGTFSSVLGLPDSFGVSYGENSISLVEVIPAPEPSSLCLLGLGFAVVLKRTRRPVQY